MNADDRDELLSAHLDGATTAEEDARIAADPELLARLAELRAASALVATPVEPTSTDARETATAAALATFEARQATVIDLNARRRVRLTIASVAAAVAVLAIVAVGLVNSGSRSTTSTSAAGASSSSSAAERATADQAAVPTAAGADSAGNAFASAANLGDFTDTAGLAAAARNAVNNAKSGGGTGAGTTGAPAASTTTTAPGPISPLATCDPDLGDATLLLDTTATLGGAPVHVFVLQLTDGSDQLLVLDASCVVLDRQAL